MLHGDSMGAMSAATHVPGAGGVVFDEAGRVLVLTLASGETVFPKGHIEAGETALEAALREVEEETGVKAWCDDPTEFTTGYVNPRGVPRRVTWFRMRSDASNPRVTESGLKDASFHPVDQALSLLTFEADRELLKQMAAFNGRAA